jgi:hypothetical protein
LYVHGISIHRREPSVMTDTEYPRAGYAAAHGIRTPRSRGAITGLGMLLLGAWGALIPFVGPYWNYAYTPNHTWTWTAARFWMQVLPGGVAFLAGLVLLISAHRVIASAAAWLGIAAGGWYVIGPLVAPLWRANYLGTPVGNRTDVSVEAIGMFYGLGAALIMLAALAAGRFSVVGVRDVALAAKSAETVPAATPVPSTTTATGQPPTAAATQGHRSFRWRHRAIPH